MRFDRLIAALVTLVFTFSQAGLAFAQATPYEKLFLITAYYSPIPGQEKYVTGSYDGDIRLNGRGTNGADGTEVYPGMVAAPKSYTFGTKMKIPGIGTVAVHDRGGAIVEQGVNGLPHDRLDIWMGYGDKGLKRALLWGLRLLPIMVYGQDPTIKEEVTLDGFDENEKLYAQWARQNLKQYTTVTLTKDRIFPKDIWFESTGSEVIKLQRVLRDFGYFGSPINGVYDETMKIAVFNFQKDMKIVQSETDLGAGHTGPQTRAKLETMLNQKRQEKLPQMYLGLNATGEDVKKLQEALKRLGYHVEITGQYDDQTVNAVLEFQKDTNVIDEENNQGAGYFGPKTKQVLTRELVAQSTRNIVFTENEMPKFLEKDLKRGDSGPEVLVLQEALKQLNYLRTEPTGYFGDVTAHAIQKLQLALNISTETLGIADPFTREKLNMLIASKRHILAAIEERQKKTLVAKAP